MVSGDPGRFGGVKAPGARHNSSHSPSTGTLIPVKDVTEGSIATDASPMRADFIAAITRGMKAINPGVPVFPSMASGASDAMFSRALGVPTYGASPVFIKDSEDFSHGLNERTPVSNIQPAITYYLSVFTDLSK